MVVGRVLEVESALFLASLIFGEDMLKVFVLAGWPYAYLTADPYFVNLRFLNHILLSKSVW